MKTNIILLISAFVFISCTTVYIPTELNTPVFREEHKFTAGVSASDAGLGLQAGYSPMKHIAVITDYAYTKDNGGDVHNVSRYGEFGAGYFSKLNFGGSIEIYGGLGFAHARSEDVKYNYTESGHYLKFFLQPDISYSLGEIDLIFAAKLSIISFTDYTYSHYDVPLTKDQPSAYEFQPSIGLRFGAPFLKIRLQLSTSSVAPVDGPDFGRRAFNGAIGVIIKL